MTPTTERPIHFATSRDRNWFADTLCGRRRVACVGWADESTAEKVTCPKCAAMLLDRLHQREDLSHGL